MVRMLILYDNVFSRNRTIRVYQNLIRRFEQEISPYATWWKLEWLKDSTYSVAAANAARKAEILLFALRDPEAAAGTLKTWVPLWIDKRRGNEGLLALFTTDDRCLAANKEFKLYRNWAAQGGMDFVMNEVETMQGTKKENQDYSLEALRERAITTTSLLEDMLANPDLDMSLMPFIGPAQVVKQPPTPPAR